MNDLFRQLATLAFDFVGAKEAVPQPHRWLQGYLFRIGEARGLLLVLLRSKGLLIVIAVIGNQVETPNLLYLQLSWLPPLPFFQREFSPSAS